jgi:hypothetical protein
MVFANPYSKPFRLTSIIRSNLTVSLQWQSVAGQSYRVEASSNLATWSVLSPNLLATGANFTFTTNVATEVSFYRIDRLP